MKKLILLTLILVSQFSFAQVEIVGSSEYGRISNLIYHPIIKNRLYAATGGNHIVVSNDNGVSWKVLYSHPLQVQIQQLKIFDDNSLSFVVDTTSGNWNKIYVLNINTASVIREYTVPFPQNSTESEIFSYSILEANKDVAIVNQKWGLGGGINSKVYYTNNVGENWSEVYDSNIFDYVIAYDVSIKPDNPKKLYITRSGGLTSQVNGGLLISNNAGASWNEKLPFVDLSCIRFRPSNSNEVLMGTSYGGVSQNLYRSTDGGDTWNVVDQNWSTDVLSDGILNIEYNPSNNNNIIVTETNSIVRTYDNFQTKEVFNFSNDIENPNNYYFGFTASFNPYNTEEIIMTNNDFPLRSVDGGASVTKITNPFFFSTYGQINLFENKDEKHLYYYLQFGYNHKNLNTSEDTPYGLLPVQSFPFTNNKFYTDKYHLGRIYGSYESSSFSGSGFSVSNNHGGNVIGIPSPHTFMHAITSKPNNENIILCSLSDDYANSNLIQFDISDINNIQQTSITLPAQGLLRDFHFDAVNSNLMWIALNENIYKTFDSGLTWILKNNGLTLGQDDKIYQIDQNPLTPNQLTLATTKGIFTSTNNGDEWSGITTEEVQSIRHSDFNENHIVAVTFDSEFTQYALRYSNDGGNTWRQVPAQDLLYLISDNKGTVIDFIGDTADVYIGTFDMGVLKYTIDFSKLSTTNPVSTIDWVTVTPNPSSDYIYLNLKNEVLEKAVFYSSTGQKVMEQNQQIKIDISHLSAGIYFIDITTKSGKRVVKKLIKK